MKREVNPEIQTTAGALVELGTLLGEPRVNPHPGGRGFIILPKSDGSMAIEYLERPALPERMHGAIKVNNTESFITAVNRHADKNRTVLYATIHPAAFTAVLNDFTKTATGGAGNDGANWRDHRVGFDLAYSKECKVWHESQKREMSQEQLAFFIEDNLPDFKTPDGARMLEIALNFRAKQGIVFKSGLRLQDGQVQLEYTEQNEGGAGAAGNMKVPELFVLEIPVWEGLDAKKYKFEARLRYKIGSGVVAFRYELVRPHKVVETAFKDVLDQIRKDVKDVPIIFGSPDTK